MIKIKYNITVFKWVLTIFFLFWNLFLLTLFRADSVEDYIFIAIIVGSCNLLALLSYILFSFFPEWYYVFDGNGIAFCMRKDKEKIRVNLDDIINVAYIYLFGVIPGGLEVKYKEQGKMKCIYISLFPKEISKVCEQVPEFNEMYNGNPGCPEDGQ